ncbi:MAG: tyrosine-type recombinase/integrase [Candidatus Omnitrophica bacterium]|nr:tyrosine-type recombinase/integrase [Candidatus Omnitrophota bacterium]
MHLNKQGASFAPQDCQRLTVDDFMDRFTGYMRDKGKKPRTIGIYVHDVLKARDHLPQFLHDVRLQHIESYLGPLTLSPATKNKYAKSLSRFFSVARRLGAVQSNPIEGFEFARYRPAVNPYSEDEIKRLIAAAQRLEQELKEPYYAFIILALQTGLRYNEYVHLRWRYLDISQGTYTICCDDVWRPKHDHKRIIRIPQSSLSLLSKLPRESEYIFHQNKNKHHHFSRDFVNNIFKAAGVKGDLHQIRKTVASYRLACGQPIQNLKEHLGHHSLKELEFYIGTVTNISDQFRSLFGEY